MLKGRLGIDSAKVPHKDRAGLLYLARGALTASNSFCTAGSSALPRARGADRSGRYTRLHAGGSDGGRCPGTRRLRDPASGRLNDPARPRLHTVSHDALRLLAHARTALAAVGEDGVRLYTAPPLIPDRSGLARSQVRLWADDGSRLTVARRMYAWRLGEVLPHRSPGVSTFADGGGPWLR